MKPLEFVLWLNGAAGILGDTPPSPEQWKQVHDKLCETIGPIVAAKLLERADALVDEDETKVRMECERIKLMQQYINQQQHANSLARGYQTLTPMPMNYGISTGSDTLGR